MNRSSLCLAIALALTAAPAIAFEIAFDWSGLKSCNSGNPNTVANPRFAVKDVPAGTKFIRFKLTDRDAPGYNHGGGVVRPKDDRAGRVQIRKPLPARWSPYL